MKRIIMTHKKITIFILCIFLLLCLGAGLLYYRSTPGYLLAREGSLELLPDNDTSISSDGDQEDSSIRNKNSSSDDENSASSPTNGTEASESETSASNPGSSDPNSGNSLNEGGQTGQNSPAGSVEDSKDPEEPGNPESPGNSDPDQDLDIVNPHRPYELPFISVSEN